MKKFLLLIAIGILALSPIADGKRILGLAPCFGKSHSMFTTSVFEGLAKRGHDVTVITSNPLKNPPENYTQIVTKSDSFLNSDDTSALFNIDQYPVVLQMSIVWMGFLQATESSLNTTAVQDFINNDNSHFDLIISELFFQEAFLMFAHKYKAPVVMLHSSTYLSSIDTFMGNPSTLSHIGIEFTKHIGGGTLYQRCLNYFVGLYNALGKILYLNPKQNSMTSTYFKSLPQPLPSVQELENNVSLVLLNSHFTFDNIRPVVPGIVDIGGVHIKPAQRLPENIQKFLDDGKDGVILLSFGSQLKSYQLEESKKQALFTVIGNLKQRVIWKWEDDNPPTHLKNVLTSKWIPQSDILAHPNLIAFISHAGMHSTIEAVYHGVPVIGIPVYGDQFMNMAKLCRRGMGILILFDELSVKTLSDAFDKILHDASYADAAKVISAAYHDQIRSPMETAMYWIEYVMRHKGAPFMKSPVVDMAWYKYYAVDVFIVYFILLSVALYLNIIVFKLILCKIISLFSSANKNKNKLTEKKRK